MKLFLRVIATEQVEESHTAEHLKNRLIAIAEKWRIADNIVAVVTDNGANIVAAVKLTGWRHIPCFDHTLNLVVSNAILSNAEISRVLQRCRDAVSYFHRSGSATAKLKHFSNHHLTTTKLKMEVSTRWNSTFFMLQSILELKNAMSDALCSLRRSDLDLLDSDWDIIQETITLLEPFEEVITD